MFVLFPGSQRRRLMRRYIQPCRERKVLHFYFGKKPLECRCNGNALRNGRLFSRKNEVSLLRDMVNQVKIVKAGLQGKNKLNISSGVAGG